MNRGSGLRSILLDALLERRKNVNYGTLHGRTYFRRTNKDLLRELVHQRDLALLARLRSPFE